MKTLMLLAIFATAKPGFEYHFPRDHWVHPEFKTEWWYWTGILKTDQGRRFGFELTFFRQASSAEPAQGPWDPRDLYLAHLTLSDVATGRFHHYERINRAGPGLAGADGRVWNGNWEASLESIRAVSETFRIDLRTRAVKSPVIHGRDGVSQKASGEGRASHYISFTRIETRGTIEVEGQRFSVAGHSWMDHEFFTHQLEPDQAGWDWMSIRLDNWTELMLFRLRRKDGSTDPFSAGTFIDAKGGRRHLSARDFHLRPGGYWKSPSTRASYPLEWKIEVPAMGLQIVAVTPMRNQELVSKGRYSPTYWEGVMDYEALMNGRAIRGSGYLEMTGYDQPIRLGR
jgi:predicted secreted hydrolase